MARKKNEKGEENKKTTAEKIPGKEKAKDRREKSLPHHEETQGRNDKKSNQDKT